MVMKKNAMRKNLSQSILKSFGRYLAIILIIALGSSLFVGLVMTKFDMVETGQQYMDEQNMFDLRLVSPYGWDLEHVEEIARMEDVEAAEGVRYLDALATLGDIQENEVFRFYNLPKNLNKVLLRGGRMPENPNECLADGFIFGEDILGMQVSITDVNEEDTLDCFTEKTFTVVGYVASPLYMDMNRGSTAIGSGSLSSFFYIPEEAFDMDYYVEINVTIPGSFDVYTDAYNDAMEAAADRLEPHVTQLVFDRYHDIYNEAMAEYEDGVKEYEDGVKEYEEEKADALQELEDALIHLGHRNSGKHYIYIHNLKYDLEFIKYAIYNIKLRYDGTINAIIRKGSPVSITLIFAKKTLIFRDSMKKWQGDLRSMGKAYGLEKLDPPGDEDFSPGWSKNVDFSKKEAFTYVIRDAQICAFAMSQMHGANHSISTG